MHIVTYRPAVRGRPVPPVAGRVAPAPSAPAGWLPSVDVHEDEDRFVLRADLPGIDPEAIEVTVEDGVLTIAGERPAAEPSGRGARSERPRGAFTRRFTLPDAVDADAVSAACRHGVLEITVPKAAAVLPRRIAVN